MKKGRLTTSNGIGPLSVKSLQLPHYQAPKQEWAPNARVCNSAASGTYSQAHEWRGSALRPGALDFLLCPSRGSGC